MAGQAISPRQPSDRTLPETDDIALPIDGWHLRHRVQANGRTCIEITDYLGDLAALIASTTLPILSVDAAWRGQGHDADRERQWWAIAIGHATVSDVEGPVVTFTRPVGRQQLHRRAVVQPLQSQGLWIASVPGLYAAVSCRQESVTRYDAWSAPPAREDLSHKECRCTRVARAATSTSTCSGIWRALTAERVLRFSGELVIQLTQALVSGSIILGSSTRQWHVKPPSKEIS
jgi:hypothetical protein